MHWTSVVTSVGTLITAVGGAAALIVALAGWLGRVWATRSVEDSAKLPAPEVIAEEIAEDLRAALEQFEAIQGT